MSVLKAVLLLIVAIGFASATVVVSVQALEALPERILTGITIGQGTLSPDFSTSTTSYTVSGITADTDNEYSVTVNATGGTNTGTLDVTVTVTNVDEEPVMTLN